MKITLLSGGNATPHYVVGLLTGLVREGIDVDCIGADCIKDAEIVRDGSVTFYNLRGDQSPDVGIGKKIVRILSFYLKLVMYTLSTNSRIFHIQWPNRFIYFDRTILNIFYKLLGIRLVLTAHNIDTRERDNTNNFINRLSLRIMYRIVDHIVVHTERMKMQLVEGFGIPGCKITVITHGILDAAPNTGLSRSQARARLALHEEDRAILFFGFIAPYKGLEYLVSAFEKLIKTNDSYKLVIAGKIHEGCENYWKEIDRWIDDHSLNDSVIKRIEFIKDEDIETYFKSSDVLALPYKHIFQSGLVFLSYNFGLPVIAADVGSLRDYVIEGKSGYICRAEDPRDLEIKIRGYYESDLYRNLEANRNKIRDYANKRYSWRKIAADTCAIYRKLL